MTTKPNLIRPGAPHGVATRRAGPRRYLTRRLSEELGWPATDPRRRALGLWLEDYHQLEQEATRAPRMADVTRAALAFNRDFDRLVFELASLFGVPAAQCIADRIPLRQVDPDTGLFSRVTLGGEPYHAHVANLSA